MESHAREKVAEATSFTYVDSTAALSAAVEKLGAAPRVAVDIEANGLYSYFHKVCLIQVSSETDDFIVDPFAPIDLEPLMAVLANATMIFHAGDYDLRMLRKSYGFRPGRPVYDTMLAAQLLGHEFLGLPKILEAHIGIETTKSGQKSDWTRRPLSAQQLAYAVDDTHHLIPLADALSAKLAGLGRLSWHEETCARMVVSTEEERESDPETTWRIKGWNGLSRKELAFLRAVWEWREEEGRQVDKPTFKVLSNPQLIGLAQAAAQTRGNALREVALPRSIRGGRMDALREAIKQAAALPASEWPPERLARGAPRPKDSVYLPALLHACAVLAKELEIAPQVIASRATIQAIALAIPQTREEYIEAGNLMQWQADLLIPVFAPIFEGPAPAG